MSTISVTPFETCDASVTRIQNDEAGNLLGLAGKSRNQGRAEGGYSDRMQGGVQ